MPPHCDSLDGPVVTAARRAIETGDVALVLPYVQQDSEPEVRDAFTRTMTARTASQAREVADLYFFETVVRLHRAGEGAAYTGLKPAGRDTGPVIPVAEKAIETGSVDALAALLSDAVDTEVRRRFTTVTDLRQHADGPIPLARQYVEAMLGLQVWSHRLYKSITAGGDGHRGE